MSKKIKMIANATYKGVYYAKDKKYDVDEKVYKVLGKRSCVDYVESKKESKKGDDKQQTGMSNKSFEKAKEEGK